MAVTNEVTAADIARIAGVGRAAVSNWRRRHPDFPSPIGGPPNSPTFSLTDVEAWLDANGRATGASPTRGGAGSTAADLAATMAALLPALTHGTVIDPGGGDGSLLDAVARRLGPGPRYVGPAGDNRLAEFRHAADAVISITPTDRPIYGSIWEYGQPHRNDYPLAWVQICLSYVKPGGTVVVAVPFAAAVRASGRRIRAELLRAGALTHVIGLPEAGGAPPDQIWILTRPAGRPDYVLRMVDLVDRDPDDLPRDDSAWAATLADPARTRDVPSIELLDEDVLLAPAAHIAAEVRDVTPEYAALRHRYAESTSRLPATAPAFAAGSGRAAGPLVTVGELARSGAVMIVDRGSARPGDVVVPGGFEAYVLGDKDDREFRTASVVRCAPDHLDPYFLAGFLRSETNRRQAAGTMGGTFRLDVRRARVPRMPLSEQRRYGEAVRHLMALADHAGEVAAAAAAATRTAIYGLTSGVFAPTATGK